MIQIEGQQSLLVFTSLLNTHEILIHTHLISNTAGS